LIFSRHHKFALGESTVEGHQIHDDFYGTGHFVTHNSPRFRFRGVLPKLGRVASRIQSQSVDNPLTLLQTFSNHDNASILSFILTAGSGCGHAGLQ
jgi:hypothetical protein